MLKLPDTLASLPFRLRMGSRPILLPLTHKPDLVRLVGLHELQRVVPSQVETFGETPVLKRTTFLLVPVARVTVERSLLRSL